MLIAEALDTRKKLRTKLNELRVIKLVADEDEDIELIRGDAVTAIEQAEHILTAVEDLTKDINRANNKATIEFGDETLTLMEAVARRDRLQAEHALHSAWVESVDGNVGRSRYFSERRKRDDVKQTPVIDVRNLRATRDDTAATIARLDQAIQRANWTTEL